MLKLDFSIESSADRAAFVQKYMDPTSNYTSKELETIANYVLYGKDEDGTSIVDRKEVQIKAKHNSYARKEAESLDALIEKPTFDERIFQQSTTRYKAEKPSINREKDFDVPGLKELWEIIDDVDDTIKVAEGKQPPKSNKTYPSLSNAQLYEYKHYLIELRRQQFTLRDMVKPTICRMKTNVTPSYEVVEGGILWDMEGSDFSIAPLGLITTNRIRFTDPRALQEKDYHYNEKAKVVLDFRNPNHIYNLFEGYEDLETDAVLDVESTAAALIETLDFYRGRAELTDEQKRILELKIEHVPNQKISEMLEKEFGITHSANYISTIYKQKICKKIADAAILHYDYYQNREIATAWKKCICCGEYKLKDTREYIRRSRSADGLASICKSCDKKKREQKKR